MPLENEPDAPTSPPCCGRHRGRGTDLRAPAAARGVDVARVGDPSYACFDQARVKGKFSISKGVLNPGRVVGGCLTTSNHVHPRFVLRDPRFRATYQRSARASLRMLRDSARPIVLACFRGRALCSARGQFIADQEMLEQLDRLA